MPMSTAEHDPLEGHAAPTRRRDPDASRRAILDAAEALFAERGYDGASMGEIGRRAGVSSALPSYFFGGKEQLYVAVLERLIAAREERPRAARRARSRRARTGRQPPPRPRTAHRRLHRLSPRAHGARRADGPRGARRRRASGTRTTPFGRRAGRAGALRAIAGAAAGALRGPRAAAHHHGGAVLLSDRAQRHDAGGDGPRRDRRGLRGGAQAPCRRRPRAGPHGGA